MATIKVRLKDASGNILHPETDWSVVLNRPSFNAVKLSDGTTVERWNAHDKGSNAEIYGDMVLIDARNGNLSLQSIGNMYLASDANIRIKDQNTQRNHVSLANYPINWTAINGKPSGTYVGSVTISDAASVFPGGGVKPGIYFYTGVSGNNLIAFVCNDSEALWGWYYDINGQKENLPENSLQYGTNLVELAVNKYSFNTKNF